MSVQGTIRRYTLEVEKIRALNFPSFAVIKEYLNDYGFEISKRTLQRDIEDIRYEFGIDIRYNRARDGYFIDFDNSPNFDSFLNFLEIVNTANLITESLIKSKETLKYISFESNSPLRGAQLLKDALYAITQHRRISFIHYNFGTGQMKKYSISPYLLKEYQKRWYILGMLANGELRLFGIDRIESMNLEPLTFTPKKNFNATTYFDNIIGLSKSEDRPEQIILQFTAFQGNYIKTLPLHHSQEIIKDDEKSLTISLNLIPNLELLQKICAYGNQVKIIKPTSLIKQLKLVLQDTLRQY
jgi:predicted DNA-binding transcriptional regulator YafY